MSNFPTVQLIISISPPPHANLFSGRRRRRRLSAVVAARAVGPVLQELRPRGAGQGAGVRRGAHGEKHQPGRPGRLLPVGRPQAAEDEADVLGRGLPRLEVQPLDAVPPVGVPVEENWSVRCACDTELPGASHRKVPKSVLKRKNVFILL